MTKLIDYAFLLASSELDPRVLDSDLVLDRPFPSPYGWLWVSDHVGLDYATLWID